MFTQVSEAGVHRPHVAGIHGREDEGAYSIVLSGGYEDDTVSNPEILCQDLRKICLFSLKRWASKFLEKFLPHKISLVMQPTIYKRL